MKAQITIFIILGAMILLAVGITFTMVRTTEDAGPPPADTGDITGFIEHCMRELTAEGVRRLGQHGGYIDPTDFALSGVDLVETLPVTDGELVRVGKTAVPFWLFQGESEPCTTCVLSGNQPTLSEMEVQLELYLETRLDGCTQNLEPFKEEGFLVTTGAKDSRATIADNTVIMKLDFPVKLERGVESKTAREFIVTIPANVMAPYLLATQLTAYQFQNYYLENAALHLISAYSGVPDSARIPPIAFFEEGFGSKTWTKQTVEERIRKFLLGRNVPLLEIQRTKGVPKTEDTVFSREVSNIAYKNQEVTFFYDPQWDIHFDVRPTEGLLLKPSTHTQKYFLNLVPTTKYNFYEFYYTFSFPVVVRVEDTKSFDGKGFLFQFALEGNIKDNKNFLDFHRGGGTIGAFPDGALNVDGSIQEKQRVPCVADGAQFRCPLDNQLFNLEIDCTQACVEDISEEPINTNDLKVRFCDEDQRISEPFDFVVKDRLRKTEDVRNPIKDASISVGCGKYKECTLGGTDSSGILNSPVPFCLGTAYALAQADGFQPKIINLRSTKPKEPQTPTFLLEPIIDRQIQIRLIPLANLFHTKDIMVTNANQLLTFLGVVERIINASAPELTPTGPVGGTITRDQWASLLGEMDVIEIQLRAMISRHKPVKHYNAMNQEVVRQDTLIFQGVAESLTLQPLIDRFETIIPDLDLLTGVLDDTTSKAILSDMILRRKNANLLTPPEITPNAAAIQRSSAFVIPDNVQVAGTLNRALQPNEQPVPASGIQQTGDGLNEVQLIFGPYESRLQVILNKKLNLRTIGIAPAAPYEDSIMGGVNLKGATSFTVSDEMLLSDKPIILYAFLFDEFQTIEDLTMIGEVEEHSIRLGEFIEPQLAD